MWTLRDIHTGSSCSRLLHYKEGDQLKIIQAQYGIRQGCGFAAREQAVEVFFFLHVNHRAYGFAQQFRMGTHIAPVICCVIKQAAYCLQRLVMSFTACSHKIEQFLGFCVVGNDFAVFGDINQIVGVQSVLLIDVNAVVSVLEREYRAWFKS